MPAPTAISSRFPLRRALSILQMAAFAVVLFAVVGSAAIYMGLRFAGVSLLTVQSPSMEPVFGPGDVVGIKPVAPWDVEEGDIVAYRRPDSPLPVIHRVKEIRWVGYDIETVIKDKDGNVVDTAQARRPREFVFQGDNNPVADTEVVQQSQIVGRMAVKVPRPFNYVATGFSRETLIGVGVAAIGAYILWEIAEGAIQLRRRRLALRARDTEV